jgi:hypothetical protein
MTIRILISSLSDRGEIVAGTVAAVPRPVRNRFHSLIWVAGDVTIPARVIPTDVRCQIRQQPRRSGAAVACRWSSADSPAPAERMACGLLDLPQRAREIPG